MLEFHSATTRIAGWHS